MDDNLSPKQIKQMINMLSAMLPKEAEEEAEEIPEPVQQKTFRSPIKSKNIDTKSKRVNKFEQMAEFTMHKEDIAFDKKVTKQPPVPRTRQYVPVTVKCRVCGKEQSVNPMLIESVDRYKCNKCSAMAG